MTSEESQDDPFSLTGVVLDGRFRIVGEIAEGGFGVVYRAVQIALDRPVALKVLKTPAGMSAAARAQFHDRFAAEAKTIARVRHPNIVDVYDFGVSPMPTGGQAPWMALEWLDGRTLADDLAARRGRGGRSPADVLALLRPVLQAFAYAHREGIVHRDIKPANIMVVVGEAGGMGAEDGGLLRVLDFGIAKVVAGDEVPGSGLTRTAGSSAFSPHYAAPEQVAYGRTGPWTDVHALGLLLTELLTDEPPYAASDMELFEEAMAQARPTPGARGRDVGPWEAVVARAVALSPGARWKDASELLTALEATIEGASAAVSDARAAATSRTVVERTAVPSTGTGTRHLSPDVRGEPAVTGTAPITRTSSTTPRSWPRVRLVAVVVMVVAVATGIGLFLAGRRPPEGRVEMEVVAPAPEAATAPEAVPAPPPVPMTPPTVTTRAPADSGAGARRRDTQKKHKKPGKDSDKGSDKLIDLAGDRQ